MTIQILAIAAIVVIAVYGLPELWIRWHTSRFVSRALDRVLHPERYASEPRSPLDPESRFAVRLFDSEVVCERPDGKVERVEWNNLNKVEIVSAGDGPWAPDLFWVLHGTQDGCAVPQGATGHKELLDRLQALPEFDNHAVIEAIGSTSEGRFLSWQRTA